MRERAGERDGGGVEVYGELEALMGQFDAAASRWMRCGGGGGDNGLEVGMVAKTGVRWGGGVIGVTCGDGEVGRLVGQRGVRQWTGPAVRSLYGGGEIG